MDFQNFQKFLLKSGNESCLEVAVWCIMTLLYFLDVFKYFAKNLLIYSRKVVQPLFYFTNMDLLSIKTWYKLA